MDRKLIKNTAKAIRKENWGTLLLSSFLCGIIGFIPLIGIAVSAPVQLGDYENYYNVYKGKPAGWRKLYSKFDKQFESSFLFYLLLVLLGSLGIIVLFVVEVLLVLLLGLIIPPIAMVINLIFSILFCLVVIPLYLMLFLGLYNVGRELLLLNPEMKGNVAFDKTIEYAKIYWKEYLSLGVLYIGKMLLTIVTLGIYGIIAFPECMLAMVILSDEILNGKLGNGVADPAVTVDVPAAYAQEPAQVSEAAALSAVATQEPPVQVQAAVVYDDPTLTEEEPTPAVRKRSARTTKSAAQDVSAEPAVPEEGLKEAVKKRATRASKAKAVAPEETAGKPEEEPEAPVKKRAVRTKKAKVAEEPEAPAPVEEAKEIICPACGKVNDPGAIFCEKCGNKL